MINFFNALLGSKKSVDQQRESHQKQAEFLRAEKLYWVCRCGVELAVYKRNSLGRNATYCNIYTYEILDARTTCVWRVNVQEGKSLETTFAMGGEIEAFDYDITPIMKNHDVKNILSTTIPVAWENGLEAVTRNEIRELSPPEAQEKANAGIPCMIISKDFNHMAIAAPHLQFNKEKYVWEILPYNEEKGCFTGNAGWENGMMYMNDRRGFGTLDWKNPDKVKYWQFRKYNGQFDD